MAVVVPYVIMAVISVVVGYAMTALQKPIEGPKIGDIAKQTAKEGGSRLIVWGIVRPIGGNVVACSDPSVVSSTSGGKGGGSGQSTESVYRTYAIGICEGPVTGIRRVWRNNKLVYDSRDNAWANANSAIFLQKATFYLGDFSQLPDPSLEAIWGVGEVPAMRGTCYMVMNHEDLTELGGALPQYIFEVVRAEGVYLTSRPYAIEVTESAKSTGGSVQEGVFRIQLLEGDAGTEEASSTGGSLTEGTFRASLFLLDTALPEEAKSTGGNLIEGTFAQTFFLVTYNDGLPEETKSTGCILSEGVFRTGLITYGNALPEEAKSTGGSLIEGTHGT